MSYFLLKTQFYLKRPNNKLMNHLILNSVLISSKSTFSVVQTMLCSHFGLKSLLINVKQLAHDSCHFHARNTGEINRSLAHLNNITIYTSFNRQKSKRKSKYFDNIALFLANQNQEFFFHVSYHACYNYLNFYIF